MSHSVFANNSGEQCTATSANLFNASPSTNATSAATSCGLGAPLIESNDVLLLGPLSDNGGASQTHPPAAGGPLIDGGSAICFDADVAITVDQRLLAREAPCDIGAVDFQE